MRDVAPGVHHIAGTYDGAALQVYLDGDLETADGGLRATGALGNYDTVHGLGIGGGFVDGAGFKGTIDEVAVYSKALPASRIREHFVAGK